MSKQKKSKSLETFHKTYNGKTSVIFYVKAKNPCQNGFPQVGPNIETIYFNISYTTSILLDTTKIHSALKIQIELKCSF